MATNNRKTGNTFEEDFSEILFEHGFWVHIMAQNRAGQPADVIACKNKVGYLIDCKVCENDTFPLSRMEQNQDTAMVLWKECGNSEGWFALKVGGEEIVMIPHFSIKALMREKSVLNLTDIREYGVSLERWLQKCM